MIDCCLITLLDGRLVKTNNAATMGKRPVGVPTSMANLGGEWDLPYWPGLTATGAVSDTGKQFVDQANLQSVPSWTKVDLGLRYRTAIAGKATTVRGGLMNAFERHYRAGVASYGSISQSTPRTLQLSAVVDFKQSAQSDFAARHPAAHGDRPSKPAHPCQT